eukprot:5062741-Pyramimonas_sp.AAC.1
MVASKPNDEVNIPGDFTKASGMSSVVFVVVLDRRRCRRRGCRRRPCLGGEPGRLGDKCAHF